MATTIDRTPTGTPLREDGPLRDIVAFFAIAFAIAWTTWLVLARVAATTGIDTATLVGMVEAGELGDTATPMPGWALYLFTRLIDFSFSIAGVAMIAATTGRAGLRRLGRRLLAWRLAPRWYGVALLPVALYAAAAGLTTVQIGGGELVTDVAALHTMLFSLSSGLLVSLLLRGAMGEELGLRGFVLPRLQARTTPVRASLVIGTVWGLWHLPVLVGRDVGTILVYLVFVHAVTMLFTWLFNRTSGSLVPVLLLHATINWEEGIEVVVPSLRGSDWETLAVVALVLLGGAAATSLRRGSRTPPSGRSIPVAETRESADPSPDRDARTAASASRQRS